MIKPLCIVAGVGPGNGAAFAQKFDAEGYQIALISRSSDYTNELSAKLSYARPYACDLTVEEDVKATFADVIATQGTPSVLIYNPKSIRIKNVEDATIDDLESDWRIQAAGCMTAVQAVIPSMKQAGGGAIVIIGATASIKGSANFAPFAAAKASQRMLAQSMARHLWPQGIHVSYLIVDGMIDEPRSREMAAGKPDDFFMKPDHIAHSVHFLSSQPRSAWTFEMDLRPFGENW